MAIIRWEPFQDIERLFEGSPSNSDMSQMGWDLAVDVYEQGNNVIAKMNLPGVDPDHIDISVEENILRITGSREEEEETKEKDYYSREIKKGSFERSVRLPADVDSDAADAEYKDGVLKIILPKQAKKPEEEKKIQIRR